MRQVVQPDRDTDAPRLALGRPSLSHVWVAVGVLAPILLVTSAPHSTIDLTYLLRAGETMLDEGRLLRVDGFTATAAGMEWANQQWLAEVALALVFRAGGWLGLSILRSVLATSILALVFLACRAQGAARKPAAWLTLASGALVIGGLMLRPQLFGLLCFALVLWLLARRERHPRGIFVVPFVTALWANLHGSFALAPVLIGLAWLDERHRRGPQAVPLAAVGVASLIATLANPLGARVWTYAVDLSTDPVIGRVVLEWQPPTIRTYAGAVFFLSVAGVAVLLSRLERPIPRSTYLTLGVFFALGLPATRGLVWWALAAPVAVAAALPRVPQEPGRDPANSLNAVLISLVGVGVVIALAPWFGHADREDPGARFLVYAPPGITQALEDVLEPGQVIFNPQAWGSWFEFRFPKNPVTTDSRFEVIPDEVWGLNEEVSDGAEGWQGILDGWDADVAVLTELQQAGLIPRMRADPGWELVYEDEDGLVFVRS